MSNHFATALVSHDQMFETTREERTFVFLNEIPNAQGAGGPDYTLADEKMGILQWSEELDQQARARRDLRSP